MVRDAYGDRWSQLTFLIYLDDDYEGGETSFLTLTLTLALALALALARRDELPCRRAGPRRHAQRRSGAAWQRAARCARGVANLALALTLTQPSP